MCSGRFRVGAFFGSTIILPTLVMNFKTPKTQKMKKNDFLNGLALLFLFAGFSLSAQQVIVEHSSGVSDNIKYNHIFDKNNYSKILDENNQKIYMQNLPLNQKTVEEGNDVQEVTLSINLHFDPNQYQAPWFIHIYDESGNATFALWEGTNPVTIGVLPGIYDVLADFNSGINTRNIVIKELIDASEDTTIDIDVVEAANYVSINTYDENGDFLEPGIDPGTGQTSFMYFSTDFYFHPAQSVPYSKSFFGDAPFADDPIWNFYINDLSNRYSVANRFISIGESIHYFSKLNTLNGITESVLLENNPEDWVFHREKFKPSPFGESSGEVHPSLTMMTLYDDIFIGGDRKSVV